MARESLGVPQLPSERDNGSELHRKEGSKWFKDLGIMDASILDVPGSPGPRIGHVESFHNRIAEMNGLKPGEDFLRRRLVKASIGHWKNWRLLWYNSEVPVHDIQIRTFQVSA